MFKKSLFIRLVKLNLKVFSIIAGALSLLIVIVMSVFTPETMQNIAQTSMDAPVNPLGDITTLIAFVANQYFGNFVLIFAMIYSIIIGNKLIAEQVDKGSMAFHLSTPITRTQYTFTSIIFFVLSLVVMFGLIFVVGYGVAELVQPGELPVNKFFILTLGSLVLNLAISSITFFASCLFNRSSYSLALGAGLTVFFYATNMLSGMNDSLEFLRNVSIITLYDSTAIIQNGSYRGQLFILVGLSLLLYFMGVVVFKRKDLPL
ncbi:ABC transporter permease subunit [Bacillus sp. UNCCL81]|uniref:ABC transporter permease n=1 Tax=Bacillus sp. UNCCL81 TaxID=1502755 RepID=UPI0008EF77F9|nr:ABC transporter permease subunit [Bacillus sp. UNCCL81]SFC43330.1 ABC-2 type transport system permease protein [Bacillus sp. UNCCL81]